MNAGGEMTRCMVASRQGVLSFNWAKMGQSRFVCIIRDQMKTGKLSNLCIAWRSKAA